MTLPFPHGTGSGQIGHNANINTSDTPGSTGGRFVGFGEEGTSAIANRAHWALSSNDDYLYGKVTRDIAVGSGAAFTSSSQSTYHLTGDVFCGDATYPGTPGTYDADYAEGMLLLFSVLDDKYNELTDAQGNEVRVAVVRDTTNAVDMYKGGTVPPPGYVGFVTDPWVTFRTVDSTGAEVQNPYTIPVSQKVRLLFGIKSTLESLPRDAFTRYHLNAAEEAPAGVVLQDGTRKMTGSFLPSTDGLLTLGDATHQWGDLYLNGPLHLGAGATITGNLIPTSDSYTIGSTGTRWSNLYVKQISAVAPSGSNTAISGTGDGTGSGIYGTCAAGSSGPAVKGQGPAGTSSIGVYGLGGNVNGDGVWGQAYGSGRGVWGLAGSVTGTGVKGSNAAGGIGVHGEGNPAIKGTGTTGGNAAVLDSDDAITLLVRRSAGSAGSVASFSAIGSCTDVAGIQCYGVGTRQGVYAEGGGAGIEGWGVTGVVGMGNLLGDTNGVEGNGHGAGFGVKGIGGASGIGVLGSSFALNANETVVIPVPLFQGRPDQANSATMPTWYTQSSGAWKANTSVGGEKLFFWCMLPHGFRPETLSLCWQQSHDPDTRMSANCQWIRNTPSGAISGGVLNAGITCTRIGSSDWDSGSLTGLIDHRIDFTATYGDWIWITVEAGAHMAGAVDYYVNEICITGKMSAPSCYHAGKHA